MKPMYSPRAGVSPFAPCSRKDGRHTIAAETRGYRASPSRAACLQAPQDRTGSAGFAFPMLKSLTTWRSDCVHACRAESPALSIDRVEYRMTGQA